MRWIEVINSRARFADHDLLAIPHFVISLRTQHHLAAHALLVAYLRQPRSAKLRHALILPKNIFGDPVPQSVALSIPLGKLFLIFRSNCASVFFFFFDLSRL